MEFKSSNFLISTMDLFIAYFFSDYIYWRQSCPVLVLLHLKSFEQTTKETAKSFAQKPSS